MPIYSHSQLSMYEQCPRRYKLCYRDRIKREREGVESFLGTMVHETLKKCYDDARLTKINTINALLIYYDNIWQQNWQDSIIINRSGLTPEHYHSLGRQMLDTYYRRYAPFDTDITIGTEMRLNFRLDDDRKHRLTGFIDRLSRTGDGTYQIHDYKTSAHLPTQDDADKDRQLGLYHLGIKKRWPHIGNIRLLWHYLAFDTELISSRSDEQIEHLMTDTSRLIEEIEATVDFLPRDSSLCNWCEYPDLCPLRKHLYTVETLPYNEYLREPGVKLVNRYAELKAMAADIESETARVREAILEYARREEVEIIRGSDRQARVKFEKKLKFPGKNEAEREALDSVIVGAGKWGEVSQLDTTVLGRIIDQGTWDAVLIDQVMRYGRIEEVSSVSIQKLKDGED